MVCVVLTSAAPGLRGNLSRWLVEVAPGVFVGRVSARVRDGIWARLVERIGDGQATMIEPSSCEQGWAARTAGRDRYHPIDIDGITIFDKNAPVVQSDTAWLEYELPHFDT